jgi:RNA methyltransferase, TrmH family
MIVSHRQPDQILLEGIHAIKHALRFQAKISAIYTTDLKAALALVQKMCSDLTPQFHALASEITPKRFTALTKNKVRTNLVALAKMPTYNLATTISSQAHNVNLSTPIIYLDDPRDLNNIGAVIRVLAATGAKCLLVSGEANPFDIAAVRASAGLHFALPIFKITRDDLFDLAKSNSLPVYGYDDSGQNLLQMPEVTFQTPAIHAFGTEREGLSDSFLAQCAAVSLPMCAGVSSLNLATSVAAALYSLQQKMI